MKESIIISALLIFGGIFVLLSNLTSLVNLLGVLSILAGIIILVLNLKKTNTKFLN